MPPSVPRQNGLRENSPFRAVRTAHSPTPSRSHRQYVPLTPRTEGWLRPKTGGKDGGEGAIDWGADAEGNCSLAEGVYLGACLWYLR